jgi:pterin-4a-carbinolamine dehydratase
MPKAFISYRRQDSGPTARRLAETLSRTFGPESVFLDTDGIRMGQNWQAKIAEALERATLLMPVIGSQWLHVHDEYGRRRIDLPEDWVRREIMDALSRSLTVIPLLISGASLPNSQALPECLQPLLNNQAYAINDEYWERDTTVLTVEMTKLGFEKNTRSENNGVVYPAPVDRSKALTPEETDDALARIPEWRVVKRPPTEQGKMERTELHRTFRFRSFEDAMHFMFVASRYIIMTDHHPDWQNIWISVSVWLTTWDINHRPSFKDVRLAEHLDKLYRDYTVS